MLNPDYKDMLQCLKEQGVEFLVVGAYAIAAHGYPRSTSDFDIWVNPTKENSVNVYRSLIEFGAPLQGISSNDFSEKGIIFQIGVNPCRIDIITTISGDISFTDALQHAKYIELDDVIMPVISLDDLIKNKIAAGRTKDKQDAKLLKRMLKLKGKSFKP
ncbi:MAG: nucleotidyltransferase [Desulfobacterales bacterium]|nr:nucleotidyltransferase [Desulfobacterales bacterium]